MIVMAKKLLLSLIRFRWNGAAQKVDNGDVSRTLPLAFLAPSLVHDIIKGQHPVDLTPRDVRRKASRLPLDW